MSLSTQNSWTRYCILLTAGQSLGKWIILLTILSHVGHDTYCGSNSFSLKNVLSTFLSSEYSIVLHLRWIKDMSLIASLLKILSTKQKSFAFISIIILNRYNLYLFKLYRYSTNFLYWTLWYSINTYTV